MPVRHLDAALLRLVQLLLLLVAMPLAAGENRPGAEESVL